MLKSYPTHDNTLDSSVAGWMTLGQGFSLSPLLSPRIHSCYTCQRNGLQRSHRGATNNSSLSQANSLSASQPRSMQPAGLCNQPIHPWAQRMMVHNVACSCYAPKIKRVFTMQRHGKCCCYTAFHRNSTTNEQHGQHHQFHHVPWIRLPQQPKLC